MPMSRLDMEDAYGYVCDCRVGDEPREKLCHSCREKHDELEEERQNELTDSQDSDIPIDAHTHSTEEDK